MNSRTYNDRLTVIIVSFHSKQIIEDLINLIEKNIKILVIENSLDNKVKLDLEKKFANVKVVIPKKNLGNGGGINLGFTLVKTEFSLILDPDTVPDKNMVDILLEYTKKIKNFSILAPKVKNFNYGEELYIKHDKKTIYRFDH